jgi:cobalt-zinc-cadmium efflux system outer membrane protein
MILCPATRAALLGSLLVSSVAAAQSPQTLRLEEAFERTLQSHPELQRTALRRSALQAEVDTASLRPPLIVGASLENALGTGDVSGVRGAELTFTVGSTFERADKRRARIEVARARLGNVDLDQEAKRLDVLAEVARRYVEAAAAQTEVEAHQTSVSQRQKTAVAATRRVQAGASPQSVSLTAEAALARAELERDRAKVSARAARRRLSVLWGERDPAFDRVAADVASVPEIPDFAELAQLIDATPELRKFAGESRVREARLQLAQAQATTDVAWEAGIRRLQVSSDTAFLGSVSIPLGSAGRAAPGIRAAQAELAELELEREAGALTLYATLADAHGRAEVDAFAVRRARESIIPALARAEESAASAYRAGALSYLEWAQLQADLLAAKRDQITAARNAHLALIEIQRLTATPFGASLEDSP